MTVALRPPKEGVTTPTTATGRIARRWPILLIALLVLALLPYFANVQAVTLMTRILIVGLIAASLGLLVGTTGLPSIGHATFSGIGGYTAALVAINWTEGSLQQAALATTAATLAAMAIGWIAVRSGGVYFLLLTLTIGQLAYYLVESLSSVTGGANGLAGVPPGDLPAGMPELATPVNVYWYVLAATALGYVFLHALTASPFGLVLQGIRDNERRMVALGYRTGYYKYAAFVVAGSVAGFAGALNVTHQRFVSPDDIGYHFSALLILAVIIGGRGSLLGAFGGAAVIVLVQNELSAYVAGYGELILGMAFVVIIVFMPQGIHGLFERGGRSLAGMAIFGSRRGGGR